eukprot:12500675-Alexandrium_andersonii.AAC.1
MLLDHLSSAPGLDSYLRVLLAGNTSADMEPPPGLDPRFLDEVRVMVVQALGILVPSAGEGLKATLLEAFAQ